MIRLTAGYNSEFLLNLPMEDYLSFLLDAAELEQDETLHRQWCALLPFMHMEMLKYVSFKDYKDRVTGKDLDLRPADEIVEEIKKLHGLE
ncbi:MAG: hypothetical protein K6G34_07220 [Lachnospiraceae bacterium]|nr:hypothetical protein [Lachnospiraceae bacterium]